MAQESNVHCPMIICLMYSIIWKKKFPLHSPERIYEILPTFTRDTDTPATARSTQPPGSLRRRRATSIHFRATTVGHPPSIFAPPLSILPSFPCRRCRASSLQSRSSNPALSPPGILPPFPHRCRCRRRIIPPFGRPRRCRSLLLLQMSQTAATAYSSSLLVGHPVLPFAGQATAFCRVACL
jgi:hypothetical protein